MKSALAMVLMIASPFLAGGLLLLAIYGQEKYSKWRYAKSVERRDANLRKYNITPFKGTKLRIEAEPDYSSTRVAYRDREGVWK